MEKVVILIAHAEGMGEMLDTCLTALARHDAGYPFRALVLTDSASFKAAEEVDSLVGDLDWAESMPLDIGMTTTASSMHSRMLDMAMTTLDGVEYALTLDSDCFPVASGWLGQLVESYDAADNVLPGIVWPWIPIGEGRTVGEIELRVRTYHNWGNTQVACQLVRPAWLREHGLKYEASDDTGFALLDQVREQLGLYINGAWMHSRCAVPDLEGFDAELNREVCVIFEDRMFHMGGASRKSQGASVDPQGIYDSVRARVLAEKGAEWILEPGNSHEYVFDREPEVVEDKMRRMYACMTRYLQTNDRLFDPK